MPIEKHDNASGGVGSSAFADLTGSPSDNTALATALDAKHSINIEGGISLEEQGGGGTVQVNAAEMTADYAVTLPDAAPGDNTFLKHTTSGVFSWAALSEGDVSSNVSSSLDAYFPIFSGTGGKTITSQTSVGYNDTFKALQIYQPADSNNFARLFLPNSSPNNFRVVSGGSVYQFDLFTGSSANGTRLNLIGPSTSHVWSAHLMGTASGAAGEYRLYKDDGTPVLISEGSNVFLGQPSRPTTATSGFSYMPTTSGTPTGVPTARTGFAAFQFDPASKKLWIYNTTSSAWESVALS